MIKQEFIDICKLSQKKLRQYCFDRLRTTHTKVVQTKKYVFAEGKFPVLLVAHLDTVHTKLPTQIVYDEKRGKISSPQGIGGDDRCGVYMIFQILAHYNCSVVFCTDEETGGVGASAFANSDIAKNLDVKYILEFDRRGKNDAVFYDCDNKDFTDFICKDFYKEAYGSFSDISIIAPKMGIAAVNLSCGYYEAHTTREYVVESEMDESIVQAQAILERTRDKYAYVEATRYKYSSYAYTSGGWYTYNAQKLYIIEYEDGGTKWDYAQGRNEEEALGRFFMDYPHICFNDIISMCEDDEEYGYYYN